MGGGRKGRRVIVGREMKKEEGIWTWRDGRRDKGGNQGEEKKYLGKKNRKFLWSHLKPQRLWVCLIFHNQSGLLTSAYLIA
jgi:hypothetical protein